MTCANDEVGFFLRLVFGGMKAQQMRRIFMDFKSDHTNFSILISSSNITINY